MYLTIGVNKYTVSKREVLEDEIKYLSVTPAPPTGKITEKIYVFRNDGLLLATDDPNNFLKTEYAGTLLTLTNKTDPITVEMTLEDRIAALEASIQEGLGI